MRHTTADRASSSDPGGTFHAPKMVGRTRSMTPEGFLLCRDVALARTGWMIYAPGETPVKVGELGITTIARDAATLFASTSIQSFMGKPVTNDHPPKGVSPENWRTCAVGTVHNVRQGTGDSHDLLLGDLLITDAQAIRDVQNGKVEVSAGYEATYEQTGPGEGRQLNIIGNHIALVERGRCGPRCAIGDQSPNLKGRSKMPSPAKKRVTLSAETRAMILDTAAALAEEEAAGGDEETGGVHVHIHNAPVKDDGNEIGGAMNEGKNTDPAMDARIVAIEKSVTDLAKIVTDAVASFGGTPALVGDANAVVEDHEGAGKAGDSAALETGFKAVVSDAEILVPGFQVPTFDAKASRKVTVDSMCGVRRKALDAFGATTAGARVLMAVNGGAATLDTAKMQCGDVAALFRAAAGAQKLLTNKSMTGDAAHLPAQRIAVEPAKRMTIADMQAANRAKYPVGA